ncbi:High cysteine protein [Giardia muris]|uniref:High cysteine protein n=1 Tax=Giardia muris TaxID=5742 RepID=A0A4Z1T6N2_GIAMU|nr:High cysteine protein [Giardia muris]|eukprot:TNJ28141.1 High cysteine protein [Giardia muris]
MLGTIDRSSGRAVPEIDVLEGSMGVKNARDLSCTEGAGTGECTRARTTCTDPNCKTCDSDPSQCTDCNAGYFVENNACTACSANCATCSDADTCASCKTGYDTPASKCNTCASGYLPDANKANCYSCSVENCIEAKADGTCSKCADEYFLDTTCKKCSAGCKTCTDATATTCSACMPGYKHDSSAKTCTACTVPGCKTCDTDVATCTKCLDGYHSTTAAGSSSVTCTACDLQNCEACNTDKSQCEACKSGFGPTYNSSLSITTCSECSDNCESCLDLGLGSGLVCVGCPTGKNPINGECVDANTKICTGSSGSCTSCLNGFQGYMDAIGLACGGEEASTSTPRRAVDLPSSGQAVGSGWMPRVSDGRGGGASVEGW